MFGLATILPDIIIIFLTGLLDLLLFGSSL